MIDVSDIAQFLYCPKKIYFMKVLGVRMSKPKMEFGREIHEEMYGRFRRRKSLKNYTILENLYLESERYGLKGFVDLVLKSEREVIPVDIKFTRFEEVHYNWKMQIVAYGVLVEENFGRIVKRAFIYNVSKKEWKELKIFPEDRKMLRKVVKSIEDIIRNERIPEVRKSKKCGYCEMQKIC
jgi:CRISPR-associated exonuclease Cas4